MSRYVPNPDNDCRLCHYADKSDQFISQGHIFCPVKKCFIDFELATECGTECEDIDINPELLKVDRLLRIGKEYQRTGEVSVFTRH